MAQVRSDGEEDRNDVVSFHFLTEETTTTQRLRRPEPELPTLPFDLLPEILCRLPVKLLIQLRCLCKFFNSLLSDPKFAKKHLQLSTKRHHLTVKSKNNLGELVHYDSPIRSVFSTSTVVTQTQLYPPSTLTNGHNCLTLLHSCDGIFCGMLNNGSYFLWNPSIRKFKLLPTLEIPSRNDPVYSFGYDHFTDNYKVVAVSKKTNEVSVHTLGTDYWTRIDDIPYNYYILYNYNIQLAGIFVSGTVNWFALDQSVLKFFILSLDLEKESYQQLFLPDYEDENKSWNLGVLRDCLCVFARSDVYWDVWISDIYWDVWIMKEYGNQESWTKLYSVSNMMRDRGLKAYTALYISEDDQLLVQCYEIDAKSSKMKLVLYDSKTGTLNIPEFQNNYEQIYPKVYIESLISP